MSNYLTTDTDLIAVADAIRAKGGTSSSLSFPDGYVSAIQDIQTGGNLEDITISQDYLVEQNTVISNGIIFQTDETYPGTPVVLNNTNYANIDNGNLGQNGIGIKIELNRTYHCTGELKIEWSTGEQEIYSIDSDFTPTGYSASASLPNFSWEGIGTTTQTFNTMNLSFNSSSFTGYRIFMRPIRTGGQITKSGVLLDGSYYQISVTSDGFNTINLNLSDDPRFQAIYKSLAYRSTIASSALGVSEWCDSLSKIASWQFAGQSLSGDFIFSNVSFVGQYAFAWNYTGGFTGGVTTYNLTFPILSSFYDNSPFAMNRGLTSIYCPSVTAIGGYTFYNCSSLTTISFPECTSIGPNAFQSCFSLVTASFPKCTTINNYAFQNCSKLTTVSFPECTIISGYAFYSCSKLASIYFPKCTSIGYYAFYSCSSLTTVSFQECTIISGNAFQNCFSLTSAYFSECTSIGSNAFYNCYSLTTISFPKCTYINYQAFYNCSNLTSAYFPECSILSTSVFRNCSNLTIISFPKCTSINNYAFYSCSKLESAYFMASSIISLGTNVFAFTPMSNSSYLGYYGSIYVPASLLASYQTAQYWSQYSSRMVGI